MKKLFLILFFIYLLQIPVFAENVTFKNEKNLWGLKDSETNEVLIQPQYKKMIILGENSYIVQKRSHFGLINNSGKVLVPIKYTYVERILDKFLKVNKGSKFAIYNADGEEILPLEYSSINLLIGGMFVTCKDYKYGVTDFKGNVIIPNVCDDIYTPKPEILRIKYKGVWYEIENKRKDVLSLQEGFFEKPNDIEFSEILEHPVATTGYSIVSGGDYFVKLFSSISPAHENTIDSLLLSQGADTVSIYFKLAWIPKYPFVFLRHYGNIIKNPLNGPFRDLKTDLKNKIK